MTDILFISILYLSIGFCIAIAGYKGCTKGKSNRHAWYIELTSIITITLLWPAFYVTYLWKNSA